MKDYFSEVLDKAETIIETFRPNKFKFFFAAIVGYCIIGLIIVLFATLAIIYPAVGVNSPKIIYRLIPTFVFLSGLIMTCVLVSVWYKNVAYCCTNKRILLRSGVVGVYYRCLDLQTIGAIDVRVNFFDKVINRNTGTIRFGSITSPMVPNGGVYAFMHVSAPYEIYRKIKSLIDNAKIE